MAILKVDLTEKLDAFVSVQVESGVYTDASDVVRAALRHLEREEQEYEAKLSALRSAIREGEESGIFPGDAFASVREELGLPPRVDR